MNPFLPQYAIKTGQDPINNPERIKEIRHAK